MKISDQDRAAWTSFSEALQSVVTEHLGEEATVIVGAQFGELGTGDYSDCAVASNLETQSALEALHDMATAFIEDSPVVETAAIIVAPDDVPVEEILAEIKRQTGVDLPVEGLQRVDGGYVVTQDHTPALVEALDRRNERRNAGDFADEVATLQDHAAADVPEIPED